MTFYKINFEGLSLSRDTNVRGTIFTEDDIVESANFLLIEGESGGVGLGGSNDLLIEISSSGVGTYRIIANDYFSGTTATNNDINTDFGFTIAAAGSATINSIADASITA